MSRQRIALVILLVAFVVALVVAPGAADAHVAPSPTENNRYVKLTLLPDSVRFSFTIFYGERPGAAERQRMDHDADGALDEKERAAFGAVVRDDVAAHVQLVVDGHAVAPAELRVEDVGLGTPVTTGGSFSVDLLAHVPTPGPGPHSLTFTDSWITPSAGENEMYVEESPGVRVVASPLVAAPAAPAQMRWSFRGNPTATERALRVEWAVETSASAPTSTPSATTAPTHSSRRVLWLVLAALFAGGVAIAALSRRKR